MLDLVGTWKRTAPHQTTSIDQQTWQGTHYPCTNVYEIFHVPNNRANGQVAILAQKNVFEMFTINRHATTCTNEVNRQVANELFSN
jgi:hypothetical protein